MRSDTAFFSAADISRRFLAGLASDLLSAAALMALESSDPAMGMSTRGGGRRVSHGALPAAAQDCGVEAVALERGRHDTR